MGEKTNIQWCTSSWNPWYGCHKISPGCAYCLSPDTPILYSDLIWRPIGKVRLGDELIAFDEFPRERRSRQWRMSIVEDVRWFVQPTMRVTTASTEIITTAEHKWLTGNSYKWASTRFFRKGTELRQIGVVKEQVESDKYRMGYLCGMTLGDGTFRFDKGIRLSVQQRYWRVAVIDESIIGRLVAYLATFGIEAFSRPFPSLHKSMTKVEIRSTSKLVLLEKILLSEVQSSDFQRGWLAGFFDAEGSYDRNLRITQKQSEPLDKVVRYGANLGFKFEIERYENHCPTARLTGTISDYIRFFSICRPAVRRKQTDFIGRLLETENDPVMACELLKKTDVVDIQTSTGTFFAQGAATHNCYMYRWAERAGRDPEKVTRARDATFYAPLRWKEPRVIFTCSLSDFFIEEADGYREEAWNVIRLSSHHTYLILSKRWDRVISDPKRFVPWIMRDEFPWPHVRFGASAENQHWLDKRVPKLLKIPAVGYFISAEPLLGPLNLRGYLMRFPALVKESDENIYANYGVPNLNAVIVGGESGGPEYRRLVEKKFSWGGPYDDGLMYQPKAQAAKWVRSIRDQCQAVEVKFILKQWGGPRPESGGKLLDGKEYEGYPIAGERHGDLSWAHNPEEAGSIPAPASK